MNSKIILFFSIVISVFISKYETVQAAVLEITVQPVGGVACLGGDYTLSVETNNEVNFYQWFFREEGVVESEPGKPIQGAIKSSYVISNAQYENMGTYYVEVYGPPAIKSDEVKIIVQEPIVITKNITDGSFCEESDINLQVSATGEDIRYQWYFEDQPIPGANTPSYTIINASPEKNYGYYQLKTYNECSSEVFSYRARIWIAKKLLEELKLEVPSVAYVGKPTRLHVGYSYGYPDVTRYTWTFNPNTYLSGNLPSAHTVYPVFSEASTMQLVAVSMEHVCRPNSPYTVFDILKVEYPTSIEEETLGNTVNVYPNPVIDELIISNKQAIINDVTIINVKGQLIHHVKPHQTDCSISAANWNSGVYFIKIQTNTGTSIHKILKQE